MMQEQTSKGCEEMWGDVVDSAPHGVVRDPASLDEVGRQDRIMNPGRRPRIDISIRQQDERFHLDRYECEFLTLEALAFHHTKLSLPNRRIDVATVAGLCYAIARHYAQCLAGRLPDYESDPPRDVPTPISIIAYKLLEHAPLKQPLAPVFENVPQLVDFLLNTRSILRSAGSAATVPFGDLVSENCAYFAHQQLRKCTVSCASSAEILDAALASADSRIATFAQDNRAVLLNIAAELRQSFY